MTSHSTALALPVVLPERCCEPGQCAYTVQRVRAILAAIHYLRQAGEDVVEAAESALGPNGKGGGTRAVHPLFHENGIQAWDVLRAIREIGGRPGAEAISQRLCPWAAEDEIEA